MSDSLQPHELHLTRLLCPPLSSWVCSNSCPLSLWCHSTISCSVVPFSSFLRSFWASESFPVCRLFESGGQSIGASALALVLPMNIQGWFPLGLTGLINLPFKGLLNLLQHHSSKVSILWSSAFCMVQLSHPYVTAGKTIAHQAPVSMEFSRQEYWSGLPFPSPGDISNQGMEPSSPALQADSLHSEPSGKPCKSILPQLKKKKEK